MDAPPRKANHEELQRYNFISLLRTLEKETNMKKLTAICFALSLLVCGVTVAQDTMKQDDMKADTSAKATKVMGKISDDGKTFVSDKDSKSWTISNPDAVKGHEGHHVTLTAHVYADRNEVHVMSLKMAADSMKK
jgi:pentapeptide MXKDX repeat protein